MDKTTEELIYWGLAGLSGTILVGQSGLFGPQGPSPPPPPPPPAQGFSLRTPSGVVPPGGTGLPTYLAALTIAILYANANNVQVYIFDPNGVKVGTVNPGSTPIGGGTMGGFLVTVVDPNGSPVAGATVIVQNPSTGVVVFQGPTNASGVADSGLTISPGSYTIQATSPNFAGASTTQTIVVGVDTPVRIQLIAGPPPISQEMLFVSLSVNAGGGVASWRMNPNWPSADTVAAFITLVNAIGQTIGIGKSGFQTLSPGQTGNFSVSFGGNVPPGNYTANTFVVNAQNAAVSGSVGQPVTV